MVDLCRIYRSLCILVNRNLDDYDYGYNNRVACPVEHPTMRVEYAKFLTIIDFDDS